MMALAILGITFLICLLIAIEGSNSWKRNASKIKVGDIFIFDENGSPYVEDTNAIQITDIAQNIRGDIYCKYIYVRVSKDEKGEVSMILRTGSKWTIKGTDIFSTFFYKYLCNKSEIKREKIT